MGPYAADPAFNPADAQDSHDLAVFFFKEEVTDIRPVSLPPVLNMLERGIFVFNTFFTVVDRGLTTWEGFRTTRPLATASTARRSRSNCARASS